MLDAFLLHWWLGLVALDLVRTINLLSQKKITRKSKIPTDGANWWSFWKSVGWWVSNAGGCKIWSWKQRVSQRRPVETGQRSSDDEVSKLILHNRKREFFWRKLKVSEWLTSSLESVYIVFVEQLLICLVIVAMVEGCNRSSLLVSVLYRSKWRI